MEFYIFKDGNFLYEVESLIFLIPEHPRISCFERDNPSNCVTLFLSVEVVS
jgi:hypothetical protein